MDQEKFKKLHVAVIPDGNRRYMRRNGIGKLTDSYALGVKRARDFIEWCIESKEVKEATIYVLSLENIRNRGNELKILLRVFSREARKLLKDKEFQDAKIKVNICGDMGLLKQLDGKTYEDLKKLEDATRNYGNFTLNLAVAYSGRAEIIRAAEKVYYLKKEFTEENFKKFLWVKSYPDIIIRTAESRLSNFLLWQSAYSELYFLPKLWQEFEKEDLIAILKDFENKDRRYGR